MTILRYLGRALALVLILAALLAGLALVPAVQTWCAQLALSAHPRLQATIGGVDASFGRLEATDLHLQTADLELTLPTLSAELPLLVALRHRQLQVHRLVAKGWTLQIRPRAAGKPEEEPAGALSGPAVTEAFHSLLGRWILPCDLALDGLDLEGEVVIGPPGSKNGRHLHVQLSGGGLAPGRAGDFAFAATTLFIDSQLAVTETAARGRLQVALATPRTLQSVDLAAAITAKGGPFPAGLALTAHGKIAAAAAGETYLLELQRGSQPLAHFTGSLTAGGAALAGTWSLALADSDLTPFWPDHPLPAFHGQGSGQFETDAAFRQVRGQGDLTAACSGLGAWVSGLDKVGSLQLAAGFDATRQGRVVRVDRLHLKVTGKGPTAELRLLHPFTVDDKSGGFPNLADAGDALALSFADLPLAWASGLPEDWTFTGGTASGAFLVRAEGEGFILRPTQPFQARGITLQHGGQVLVHALDVTADLHAQRKADGWQVEAAPLRLTRGGRPLGELAVKATHPAGQPLTVTGRGQADLPAVAASGAIPALAGVSGQSVQGDFSAAFGDTTAWEGQLSFLGRDPHHSLSTRFRAEVDQEGAITFLAPLKLAFGPTASEVSADGKWSRDEGGSRLSLKLNAENVREENLRGLAALLARASGSPGASQPATGEALPFWGRWSGTVQLGFDHVHTSAGDYSDVSGSCDFDHSSIRLAGGHVGLAAPRTASITGSLTFTPLAKYPYQLQMAAAIDPFKAGPAFPAAAKGDFPIIEGTFTIAAHLAGQGSSLADLLQRSETIFQLTSTNAVTRFLATDVHEAIPPQADSSRVSDALGSVGSAVGSFFGVDRDSSGTAKSLLSPNSDAIIDFTHEVAELGFDRADITAVRASDGSFRLSKIDLAGERERLTGTGEIASAPDRELRARPLSLDLQFWSRGRPARLLEAGGLLSGQKDEHGFAPLRQPVHFGGTLEHIDISAWHHLLVTAAVPRPVEKKKKAR